jgi:hypothetical protein
MGRQHTLEDSDGGREVVDTSGGLEGGDDDGGGGDKVVCEGVVQVALWGSRVRLLARAVVCRRWLDGALLYLKLENILDTFKLLLVSVQQQHRQRLAVLMCYPSPIVALPRPSDQEAYGCNSSLRPDVLAAIERGRAQDWAYDVGSDSHLAVNSSKLSSW